MSEAMPVGLCVLFGGCPGCWSRRNGMGMRWLVTDQTVLVECVTCFAVFVLGYAATVGAARGGA